MALEQYTEEEKKDLPPIVRNPNGTFAKGSKGQIAIQNYDYNTWSAGLREQLRRCITKEDIQEILLNTVKLAKKGHRWATEEILNRCFGKPSQTVNIEGPDNITWQFKFDLSEESPKTKQIDSNIIDIEPIGSDKDSLPDNGTP